MQKPNSRCVPKIAKSGLLQAVAAMYMKSAVLWDITQCIVVIPTDVSGQHIDPILKGQVSKNLEDGSERLSRNVGKDLPQNAA